MDNYNIPKHKTFISYMHPETSNEKEVLIKICKQYNVFEDYSIGKGDIVRSEFSSDDEIRKEIVNEWISGATVTILLVSKNMWESKFIDWEMQATMSDNTHNGKMGLLCIYTDKASKLINLNSSNTNLVKTIVKKLDSDWTPLDTNSIDNLFIDLPHRVKKNIKRDNVKINTITWKDLFKDGEHQAAISLKHLIHEAFELRSQNKYDISDKLQRNHK